LIEAFCLRRIEGGTKLIGQRVQRSQKARNRLIARLNASAQIAAGHRRRDVVAVLIQHLLHAIAAGGGVQCKALRTHNQGSSIPVDSVSPFAVWVTETLVRADRLSTNWFCWS
jgi:hypothetical protein